MALAEAELAKWRAVQAAVEQRPREDRERAELRRVPARFPSGLGPYSLSGVRLEGEKTRAPRVYR
jgi:hypothetical protein